ncbi:hypothetical protein E9Y_07124 [Moraxella catarrhalis 101P30B1]|nr:hypothetical protein E9Y_07124 [Moraxella catarrhalis 101P30B1]
MTPLPNQKRAMMEQLKTLTVQIEHQIVTITLNRPNKKMPSAFR